MSRVFPKQSRVIAAKALVGVVLLATFSLGAVWYYATPKYARVGYVPVQPIPFSHELHVGQVGLDCTYCHTHVKESPVANLPTAQTCWNCHGQDRGNIKSDSPLLAPLRESYQNGRPIEWVRVHKVPDYAYFNHEAHVNRGVSCVSCHGQVNEMPVVRHDQPLSMSWCLDCHRNPAGHLRPNELVTRIQWDPQKQWEPSKHPVVEKASGQVVYPKSLEEYGRLMREASGVNPPTNCTGCHR